MKYILVFLMASLISSAQNIYCYAGTGVASFSGDGGNATVAELNQPSGMVIDAAGNLFFCDYQNHRIRKIDPSGIISTIGGGGLSLVDGIPATSAGIPQPTGIALDAAGNIYFSETLSARVRKISASGIITTVAGNGSPGYSGDGGPATSAQLKMPYGIAIDGLGNIFIADLGNHRIRMVNSSGSIITIAGNGTNGFSGDGGLATSAQLNFPSDIKLDALGNVFIVDGANRRIRKINTSGSINTIAGNGGSGYSGDGGPATLAQIGSPIYMHIDSPGNIYFTENWNGLLWKINTSGIINRIAGTGTLGYSGDGGPANLAQLNNTSGISLDLNGNIYFGEYSNHKIRIICVSNCVMGFEETGASDNFKLYPTPTNQLLNISTKASIFEKSYIEIINYLGQTALKLPYQNQIDVSGLAQGVYILKLNSEGKTLHSKFIKQ